MSSFWRRDEWNEGDLCEIADEGNVKPLDGSYDMGIERSVPAYDDDMKQVFRLACGARVIVLAHPRASSRRTRYVQVMANGTSVWVASGSLRKASS